jgi:hypothetical protein
VKGTPNNNRRWKGMKQYSVIIAGALLLLGIIAYLAATQSSGPALDRNVPGATTESGRSSIKE